MSKVTFDYSKACGFVQDHEMQYMSELAEQAKEKLLARTGAGNDFLGWIDLPEIFSLLLIQRSQKSVREIRLPLLLRDKIRRFRSQEALPNLL